MKKKAPQPKPQPMPMRPVKGYKCGGKIGAKRGR